MNATPLASTSVQRSVRTEHFVGEDFSWLPGISALGALLRTARLNYFQRTQYASAYGLRFLRREDVSHVLTFSATRKKALGEALGIEADQRALWDIEAWLPFAGSVDWDCVPWAARICPCCARLGYHTLLFQLPWIERCPWHGEALIRHCTRCDRTLSAAMTAPTIGRCRCKRDFVNVREGCRYQPSHMRDAARWTTHYLAWAKCARESHVIAHAKKPLLSNWRALGQLVDLPADLRARGGIARGSAQVLHARRICPKAPVDASVTELVRDMPVSTDGIIELSPSVWKLFRAVGYNVVEKLPDATLSDNELRRFFEASPRAIVRFTAQHRATLVDNLLLPVQTAASRAFLYTNSMAKYARELVVHVGTTVDEGCPAPAIVGRLGLQMLLRAYAEGVRVILSRSIPALFDMPRDRPHLTAAWVLLATGATARAKIVWAPLVGDHQAVFASKVRNNSRKRHQSPLALPNRKQNPDTSGPPKTSARPASAT